MNPLLAVGATVAVAGSFWGAGLAVDKILDRGAVYSQDRTWMVATVGRGNWRILLHGDLDPAGRRYLTRAGAVAAARRRWGR